MQVVCDSGGIVVVAAANSAMNVGKFMRVIVGIRTGLSKARVACINTTSKTTIAVSSLVTVMCSKLFNRSPLYTLGLLCDRICHMQMTPSRLMPHTQQPLQEANCPVLSL